VIRTDVVGDIRKMVIVPGNGFASCGGELEQEFGIGGT
jgi:hypothetical protein